MQQSKLDLLLQKKDQQISLLARFSFFWAEIQFLARSRTRPFELIAIYFSSTAQMLRIYRFRQYGFLFFIAGVRDTCGVCIRDGNYNW